ncbi:ribosome assembly RNA-binding protein YhbY [Anaerosphaera multitolerans]|uniref:Ribosome assembly RNA-binding protein YhbY n=1 Tax=Anaerosphaera multitolerans TaxID=2487351 RepID=A0A437S7U6_9FIRM|nr:ribosome assembly RNA-binding protein YhbY [Anaerosphaera multitolerans]RVU54917.1 ribosome assembly RNA-binding protein YhbY [Anaerosphaera multitolerans]
MITGKQRSYLKSIANNTKPLIQVGKNGITDSLIKQIDELLEAHEIVKISVLKNSPLFARDITEEITDSTNSEFVQQIGNKLTIYRESKENKKIEL